MDRFILTALAFAASFWLSLDSWAVLAYNAIQATKQEQNNGLPDSVFPDRVPARFPWPGFDPRVEGKQHTTAAADTADDASVRDE